MHLYGLKTLGEPSREGFVLQEGCEAPECPSCSARPRNKAGRGGLSPMCFSCPVLPWEVGVRAQLCPSWPLHLVTGPGADTSGGGHSSRSPSRCLRGWHRQPSSAGTDPASSPTCGCPALQGCHLAVALGTACARPLHPPGWRGQNSNKLEALRRAARGGMWAGEAQCCALVA